MILRLAAQSSCANPHGKIPTAAPARVLISSVLQIDLARSGLARNACHCSGGRASSTSNAATTNLPHDRP
jgi:hypothetical protein